MGMFDEIGLDDAVIYPALNTNTSLDMATGTFELGANNKYYLNGGLPPFFGIGGRGGYYKSTVLEGILAFCLHNYPGSMAFKLDTESNALLPKARMKKTLLYAYGDSCDTEAILDRLKVNNLASMGSKEFEDTIAKICDYKEKHKKEQLVDTPFLDRYGKNIRMWIPTFICVDSLTMLSFTDEVNKSENLSVEDKSKNMDALRDGLLKKRLLTNWSRLAYKYGLYFMMSAQVDDTFIADEYNKPIKQNQYTGNSDRFKGVGPMFEFLTNTLLQNFSPAPLVSSSDRKSPEYSIDGSGLVEINEITTKLLRCKSSPAGTTIPMLASQNYGVLPGLSYYHYLKKSDDFGFNVSGVGRSNRYCMLAPDTLLKRQTVLESLKNNYELNRALEVMYQLKWMIDCWSKTGLPFDLPKTAEEFVDRIVSGGDLTISDIVNSRGYWTYEHESATDDLKRPYMSIFDILSIINIKK